MAEEKQKSVGWVVLMLALVVLYFGWTFLASEYFKADPNSPARTSIWANSVAQLSNMPGVISYGFRSRFWIIGLTIGLEVGVLLLGLMMKKLERELWTK